MKTRERIKRTRESKSWSEQFSLVHEQLPGTRMDGLFSLLLGILRTSKTKTPAHVMTGLSLVKSDLAGLDIELIASDGDRLQSFGMEIARLIKSGNSDFFREMASAVDAWNSPRPEPDKFRVALFRFCIPQGKSFTMRAIIEHLREVGLILTNATRKELEGVERRIRTLAVELHIKIKGKPGRPLKPGRERPKNRRL